MTGSRSLIPSLPVTRKDAVIHTTRKAACILAVGDAPETLQALQECLTREHTVIVTDSGPRALEIVLSEPPPDLVLLDLSGPGQCSFKLCHAIKSLPQRETIPVVLLAGRGGEEVARGFEMGAEDCIVRPFTPPELLARVRAHLGRKCRQDQAAAWNAEYRDLLRLLGHDLANTFTAITGILEYLRAGYGDLQELLAELDAATRNGVAVLEMLRQMSRLAERAVAGGPVDIGAALARSLHLLSRQIEEKRIVADVRVEDSLRVWAEEVPLVNSVLNNLLTNAVKFSHPGGRIEIRAESDPRWVRLSIRDRGIGIPPALLEHLRGTQKVAARSGTLGEPGVGFGLRLAGKFVESYGGSLQIRSVEKGGGEETPGTEVTLALRNAAP